MKTSSVVLTVHDKGFMIDRVISGILNNISTYTKELILVFYWCTDNSMEVASKTLKEFDGSHSVKVIIEETPDIWETKANNIGLKLSSSDTPIIIQDDMIVTEPLFDQRLMKPLQAYSDVFAVTGRTAHNDSIIDSELVWTDAIGRENPTGKNPSYLEKKLRKILHRKVRPRRNIFGIRDVVNRGPLLIDNQKIQTLNYLDEAFAPLDLDDHDLCLRAYKEHNWLCGSYQMSYLSDLDWGGTRMNPTSHKIWFDSHTKNKQLLIDRHYDLLISPKHDENRILK